MGEVNFLLSLEFLLVNLGEAIDERHGEYVGGENRCHGSEENNRSIDLLYLPMACDGCCLEGRGRASGRYLCAGVRLTLLSNVCALIVLRTVSSISSARYSLAF
jgi:hypothetical protein